MSLVKPDSIDQLTVVRPRYAWETEETLVEQRKRLRYRIQRLISRSWKWLLLFGFIMWMLLDAQVMIVMLTSVLPAVIQIAAAAMAMVFQFVVFFWFLGRSRMYTIWPGQEGVSFDDYRGQPELLDQAKQIVKLLRGVKAFEESGGEPLNGLLLEGPPGTGKTWLAQAISTEAGVPFFFIDASSLQSMFVGIGPLKVANVYRRARRAARDYGASIIFIDEIDAIGSRAGVSAIGGRVTGFTDDSGIGRTRLPMFMGMGGGMGLLSTLLIEMSGFSLEHGWWARKKNWWYRNILRRKPPKPQKRVLTIGATNRISALDPALLRPGRFDKKIRIDAPDMEGRRDIISYYLSKMAHDETMDPLILATETVGYTPADIKYLLNEALRYALFDGRTYMTYQDFRLSQPEHEFGTRMPIKNLAPEDKYRLAAHEVGHAICVRLFMPHCRIARITIIRQGGAHGHVSWYPAIEDHDFMSTYEILMNRLRTALGGKAGELEFCGEGSQTLGVGVGVGGGSDFGVSRALLAQMADAGMFGVLGANFNGSNYTPEMREAMEDTFRETLAEVRLALRAHKQMGERLIQIMIEKDELLAKEVEEFFDEYGLHTPKPQIGEPAEIAADGGKPDRVNGNED